MCELWVMMGRATATKLGGVVGNALTDLSPSQHPLYHASIPSSLKVAGMDACGFVPVTNLVDELENEVDPETIVEIVKTDDKVQLEAGACTRAGGELTLYFSGC